MDSIFFASNRRVLDPYYFEFVFSSIFLYSLFYVIGVEREKNEDSLPSNRCDWKNESKKGVANH